MANDELLQRVAAFKQLDNLKLAGQLTPQQLETWKELKRYLNRELFGEDVAPEVEDRREGLRVDTNFVATFQDATGFERAYLRNVADGGVYLQTDRPLELGDRFDLTMHVEELDKTLTVLVEVVWINPNPTDKSGLGSGVGVCFLNLDPETKKDIKRVIHWALERKAVGW